MSFSKWIENKKDHLNEYGPTPTSSMQSNRMVGATGAYGTKRHTIETQGAPLQKMIQVAMAMQQANVNPQQAMEEMMEMIPVAVSQAYKGISPISKSGYGISQLKRFQQQAAAMPTQKPQPNAGTNMPQP